MKKLITLKDLAAQNLERFRKLSPAEQAKDNQDMVAKAEAYLQTHPQRMAR
jgi:hypothetical protein